jgi:ribosome-binding factor A
VKGMRGERLAEEIHRELADILLTRVRDPRLGLATVTRVEVSTDGARARILVSFLGDDLAEASGVKALESAAAFIRGELGHRLDVRRVPELVFRADPGLRHSLRIQQALRDLGMTNPAADGKPSSETPPGEALPGQALPGETPAVGEG